MVVKKISELPELALAAANDELVVVDKSDTTEAPSGTTKRIVGAGFSGLIDHGSVQGLGDDDHPQYLTTGRHDATDHSTALDTAALGDLGDVDLAGINTGAILYWTGVGWVDLLPGTLGQILQANAAGIPAFTNAGKIVDSDSFVGGGASSTVEFTVFTLTIPQGDPAADTLYRVAAWGGVRRDSGTIQWRLKINGNTILDTGADGSPQVTVVEVMWKLDAVLAFASPTSQALSAHMIFGGSLESWTQLASASAEIDTKVGRGASTADSTAGDVTIELTAQFSASDADHKVSADKALLERAGF